MQVQAKGKLPNSNEMQTFRHENWFHASALKDAQLQDPGLALRYSDSHSNPSDTSSGSGVFSVTAAKGVSAFTWLDYPAGAVVTFEDNGFWLAKGETKRVGFRVKSDETYGGWKNGVTVMSLWNQTLSE